MNADDLPGAARVNRLLQRLLVLMGILALLAGIYLLAVSQRFKAARAEYTSVPLVLQFKTVIEAELETSAMVPLTMAVEFLQTLVRTNHAFNELRTKSRGPFQLDWVVRQKNQRVTQGRCDGTIASSYSRDGQRGWILGSLNLPKAGQYRLEATLRAAGEAWQAMPALFVIEPARSGPGSLEQNLFLARFCGPLLLFTGGLLLLIRLALAGRS